MFYLPLLQLLLLLLAVTALQLLLLVTSHTPLISPGINDLLTERTQVAAILVITENNRGGLEQPPIVLEVRVAFN